MSTSGQQNGAAQTAPPPKAPPKQNPVFRMMGLPNWRLRLPSRNWLIFLSVTGSFAAALTYDRRQQKKVQKKWCDLVAHVAQEKLPVNQMPRQITVFISAPPGDGIRPSRDYFRQYIKPILVSAAMDYDVIEGRKEGEVRYGTAEQIRRRRRKQGESGNEPVEEEMDVEKAIEFVRDKMQVAPEPGIRGDLVLGRHTWKEYIRGVHEGWLGPLDEPAIPAPEEQNPTPVPKTSTAESSDSDSEQQEAQQPQEKEKKPQLPPPAYLATNSYSLSPLSAHTPSLLEPSQPIYQQHLLGFLKTPQRIYNFLTRRYLTDELGRQTAAIVLATHRPYEQSDSFATGSTPGDDGESPQLATLAPESDSPQTLPQTDPASLAVVQTASHWEQQGVLDVEERTWHKSARQPRTDDDKRERVWHDKIAMDARIAQRMRRFELSAEEETRANRIGRGEETSRAVAVDDLRSRKVIVGDVDTDV